MKSEHFSNLHFIQYFKGFEFLRRWTMNHHSLVMDFSNLDFETINIEIMADEAKEQEEVTAGSVGGEDVIIAEGTDLGQGDKIVAPSI